MTLFIWAEEVVWCQTAGIPAECDYEIMYVQICAICSGGFTDFFMDQWRQKWTNGWKNTAVAGTMQLQLVCASVRGQHMFISWFLEAFKVARNLFPLKINKVQIIVNIYILGCWRVRSKGVVVPVAQLPGINVWMCEDVGITKKGFCLAMSLHNQSSTAHL